MENFTICPSETHRFFFDFLNIVEAPMTQILGELITMTETPIWDLETKPSGDCRRKHSENQV